MILYHVFVITVFLVSKPLKVAASPEIFSAVISDLPCSLSLTLKAGKVDIAKSSVQCITNQAVSVESVKVVNDDTDHIFQLKLTADSKKTKLISASVLANAKRPVDDKVGLEKVAKRGRRIGAKTKPGISALCTYQDPEDVDWNPCQETGIRSKALKLIAESEPMACLRYRTMSDKCKGGTRGYKQSVSIRARGPPAAAKGDNKTEPEQETGLRNRAISSATIQWKGRWGSFPSSPNFRYDICPDNSFVYGYRLRSESSQGQGDDTAINDIELYCRRPNSNTVTRKIWSDYRTLGSWSSDAFCQGNDNPVVGFDVREEGSQGSGDDTAINDIDLYCNNGGKYISAPVKANWGSWKPVQRCPSGQAVVGILTQVEPSQGGGDDTALNGLKLYCKPYTAGNCPQGWSKSGPKCYKIINQAKSWYRAVGDCKRLGGDLASILDKHTNDFIVNLGKDIQPTFKFIIGGYEPRNNVWDWIDRSDWGYTNWIPGQPDNWRGNEDCLAIDETGRWNDISCNLITHWYVCAKPL